MTRRDIEAIVSWREPWLGRFEAFSPMFNRKVAIEILADRDYEFNDRSVQIVNDFLLLSPSHLETIADYLWEHCERDCELTSYGFVVQDGETETQANHREFGVFNAVDALTKSHFLYLQISESELATVAGNYGLLKFDNEWSGGLVEIVMKNRKLVDCGDDGLYIGAYE